MRTFRLNHTNTTMLLVAIVVALLFVLNYSAAQWTPAPANPPSNNVPAPLNTSANSQIKSGPLSVGGLNVQGSQQITNWRPRLYFRDTTSSHRGYWLQVNQNMFDVIVDRNNDNVLTSDDSPYMLRMRSDGPLGSDYARFSNQVRARSYCDYNGQNCFTATEAASGGSAATRYEWRDNGWGSCVANTNTHNQCGWADVPGTQARNVYCYDTQSNQTVNDSNCSSSQPVEQKSCTAQVYSSLNCGYP